MFTSIQFLVFLCITTILYYTIFKHKQSTILLLASYLFYGCFSIQGLFYIIVTTVSAYVVTVHMAKIQDKGDTYLKEHEISLQKKEIKQYKISIKHAKKRIMLIGVLLNLGILCFCKYTNFIILNLNSLKLTNLSFMSIFVPLGISFYTFMTLSYIIDIYHNRYKVQTNLCKFALYVSFFPQLIQGPISKYSEVSVTMYKKHIWDKQNILFACQRIIWGYFKKLVIADRVAIIVSSIVARPDVYYGSFVLVGVIAYAIQIYADFTGGIDITIGIGQLFGIKLQENFNRPYFSKSIKEYWNRWHITMGTWFSDYIFYPVSISKIILKLSKKSRKLFGNTIGKRIPLYIAVLIVWLTTGIWHGASWNFVVWGFVNCFIILLSNELEPMYSKFHTRFNVKGKTFFKVFQVCRTLLLLGVIRMLDYYRDISLSFKMFISMLTTFNYNDLFNGSLLQLGIHIGDYFVLVFGVALMIYVSLKQRNGSVRMQINVLPYYKKFVLWYGLILVIIVFGMYGIGFESSQFIYNQF